MVLTTAGLVGGILAVSGTAGHPILFLVSMGLLLARTVLRRRVAGGSGEAARREWPALDVESASLDNLVHSLTELSREIEEPERASQALPEKVEEVLAHTIPFLLARADALEDAVSLKERAQLISLISECERNLNRTWSALTDGYSREAVEALDTARERFGEALALLPHQEKKGPSTA